MNRNVLLWDDDIVRLEDMEKELKKQKMKFQEIDNYSELIEKISHKEYIVVLSLEMFEELYTENWKEELYRICHNYYGIFCVFGKEPDKEEEVIKAGAVDYIVNEKDIAIMISKIKNWSYYMGKAPKDRKEEVGDYELNEEKRELVQGNTTVRFSPLEYHLFWLLKQREGEYCDKEYLYSVVWRGRTTKNNRVVDTTIKQIRNKLFGTDYTIFGGYGKGYALRCRKMSVDK